MWEQCHNLRRFDSDCLVMLAMILCLDANILLLSSVNQSDFLYQYFFVQHFKNFLSYSVRCRVRISLSRHNVLAHILLKGLIHELPSGLFRCVSFALPTGYERIKFSNDFPDRDTCRLHSIAEQSLSENLFSLFSFSTSLIDRLIGMFS